MTTPEKLNRIPRGNDPPVKDHRIGARPPDAASVDRYGELRTAPGSRAVVMCGTPRATTAWLFALHAAE